MTADPLAPAPAPAAAATRIAVRVRDLPLLADIGINPDEIGRRQPLVVSVELTLSATEVGMVSETVDYRRIVSEAEALALVHIPLIETFAHRLAARCLALGGVEKAFVSVDKPFAIMRGMAGTQVEMRRPRPSPVPAEEN